MDFLWLVTILANCSLLFLLLKRCQYLNFFFLTALVSFNAFTAPLIWYVYRYLPSYYDTIYYGKGYALYALWFAVVVEAHYVGQKKIAFPVELYAFIKIFAAVTAHVGFVQTSYWINQGMRIFNLAVILIWITMFYTDKESHYV